MQTYAPEDVAPLFEAIERLNVLRFAVNGYGLKVRRGRNPHQLAVTLGERSRRIVAAITDNGAVTASQALSERIAELLNNPARAMRDYSRLSSRCICCGKSLTDGKSLAIGIGPDCLGKMETIPLLSEVERLH